MRVKMEMENSQLARKVRMLKRIPGYMYGHLGAMSGMSPLIPVPFDFLSGGCWVMVARKDRFRVEQAAAGTRPPPQCQPGSLCSFAPLLSALLL